VSNALNAAIAARIHNEEKAQEAEKEESDHTQEAEKEESHHSEEAEKEESHHSEEAEKDQPKGLTHEFEIISLNDAGKPGWRMPSREDLENDADLKNVID